MKPLAILTIVSNNYLHYARTLMQTVKEHHPEAHRYCVIVDTDPAPAAELKEEFDTLTLNELNLPFGDEFMFQYTILELNTAVKPWALQTLLDRGHSSVFYIDPDICLFKSFDEVNALLNDGASLVLTPHLLSPMTDLKSPNELAIRVAGTYNLGFCALSKQEAAYQFLTWWQGKLARDCVVDITSSIFVDQSWVDLAPGLFDNVKVLRHPGYNIAYWNIAQRSVTREGERFLVNKQDLVFFHYSGIDPQNPQNLSKHQNRYTLDTVEPEVKTLVLDYCAKVVGNGIEEYRKLPYGFTNFNDGTKISVETRRQFRLNPELRKKFGPKPFAYTRKVDPSSVPRSTKVTPAPAPAPESAQTHLQTPEQAEAQVQAQVQAQLQAEREMEAEFFGPSRGAARLTAIYNYFLGRNPDPSAMRQFEFICGSTYGYMRVAFGVARSGESRSIQGWRQRIMLWPAWWLLQRNLSRGAPVVIPDAVTPIALAPIAAPIAVAPIAVMPDVMANATPPEQYSAAAVPKQKLGINLVGYIAAELGVGEAARSLANACHASEVEYSVVDVGYQTTNMQRDTKALENATKERFEIDLLFVNADQTPATLKHLKEKNLLSPYKIGFWHWEQPQLPKAHYASFEHLNEVWVPSRFVRDAVAAVSPVPVVIIPHAMQVKASDNLDRKQFGLPKDKVCCLIMYDFHSYQYRKNPQAAIAAFRAAMNGEDDAILVVKTINSDKHPEAAAQLRACLADLPGTVVINEFLTRQKTWDLQACCDMLISLHRAEGFGLAPAEMMALGKPVVATGWSANMDFMNEENSMPVKFTLEPLAQTLGAYPAGPLWAEVDVDHAANCIRQLIDQPELRKQIGDRAKQDIERQLAPAAVGELVRNRLALIESYWHPAV